MHKKTRATIVLLPKYKEANNIYEHLYYTELFEGEEFLKKSDLGFQKIIKEL